MFGLRSKITVVTERSQLEDALRTSDRVIVEGDPGLLNYALGYVEHDAEHRTDLSFETAVEVAACLPAPCLAASAEKRTVARHEPEVPTTSDLDRRPSKVRRAFGWIAPAVIVLIISGIVSHWTVNKLAIKSVTGEERSEISGIDSRNDVNSQPTPTATLLPRENAEAYQKDLQFLEEKRRVQIASNERARQIAILSEDLSSARAAAQAHPDDKRTAARVAAILHEMESAWDGASLGHYGPPSAAGIEGASPGPHLRQDASPPELAGSSPQRTETRDISAADREPPVPTYVPTLKSSPSATTSDAAAVLGVVAWPLVALAAVLSLLLVASRAIKANRNLEITWKVTEKVTGRLVITKVKTAPRKKAA